MQKPSQKTQNPNFRGQAIQEPIFPADKTDLEGGVDGRGFFGWIFLVKHGQPSHITPPIVTALKIYHA
jgi:hypothetical protein